MCRMHVTALSSPQPSHDCTFTLCVPMRVTVLVVAWQPRSVIGTKQAGQLGSGRTGSAAGPPLPPPAPLAGWVAGVAKLPARTFAAEVSPIDSQRTYYKGSTVALLT